MIATASFTIHYPNNIENSCWNSLDFIKAWRATD